MISINAFGAVGDGAQDDTAAIQLALNSGARHVHAVPTTAGYRVSGELTVPAGVMFDGYGARLIQTGTAKNLLALTGPDVRILNWQLVGNPADVTRAPFETCNGVFALDAHRFEVRGCTISGFQYNGILERNCDDFVIADNLFHSSRYINSSSGDIVLYSTKPHAGGRLTGNRCFSNNSQGIYAGISGNDTDLIIEHNHCITRGGLTGLVTADNLKRRHGIILGYLGGTQRIRRTICGSNIIQNTSSSGIYHQANPGISGSVIICNNIVKDSGINTPEGPLASAICLAAQGDGDIVTGNVIDNNVITGFSVAAGISVQTNSGPLAENVGTLIANNTISNMAAHGIMIINSAQNVAVRNNSIWNTGLAGVLVALPVARSYPDHTIIEGNTIKMTVAQPAIWLNSIGDLKTRVTVRGNVLTGVNNATKTHENTGVYLSAGFITHSLTIADNQIERFHNGVLPVIYLSKPLANIQVTGNTFIDCAVGLAASSSTKAGRLVGTGNIYRDCNLTVGAGSLNGNPVAVEGVLVNGMLTTAATNVPTMASFNAGDRVEHVPAAVGTPKAWRCTVSGAPGTWVSEGNL
jgi:hypothetical protein